MHKRAQVKEYLLHIVLISLHRCMSPSNGNMCLPFFCESMCFWHCYTFLLLFSIFSVCAMKCNRLNFAASAFKWQTYDKKITVQIPSALSEHHKKHMWRKIMQIYRRQYSFEFSFLSSYKVKGLCWRYCMQFILKNLLQFIKVEFIIIVKFFSNP